MVFGPRTEYLAFGLSHKGPLYYSRLPLLAALDGLALAIPDWIIQKAILLSIIPLAGLSAFYARRDHSVPARLFAGTLYAVNPFVYARVLAGHWYLLLGYALLPLAVRSSHEYLRDGGWGALRTAALWATLATVPDPHVAGLFGLAAVVLTVVNARARRSLDGFRRLGRLGAAYAAVNAYWILPAATAMSTGATQLSSYTVADLRAFSASGTIAGNVPLSVAMLWGFWRDAAVTTADLVGLPTTLALFGALLFLAVSGARSSDDSFERGLAALAVVAFFLAMGASTPVSRALWDVLFAHVPGAVGMRDTQKFVALLALSYAFLGAAGVEQLWNGLGTRAGSPRDVAGGLRETLERLPSPTARALVVGLFVLSLALPVALTLPALGGFWGQLHPVSYPDDWERANERLAADDDEFRVLFLPWHQYVAFSWTGRTVATPADAFFGPPIVRGRNLEIGGIGTQVTDPTHRRVDRLLADREAVDDFGAAVAPLGVKYVALSKEADYRAYDFLDEQDDLSVVLETDEIVLYENEAFGRAGPPEAWPRAGARVPKFALAVGVVASLCAVVALRSFRGELPGA
jgi:hypothetical protein